MIRGDRVGFLEDYVELLQFISTQRELFVGIREGYINVYFKGMRVFRLGASGEARFHEENVKGISYFVTEFQHVEKHAIKNIGKDLREFTKNFQGVYPSILENMKKRRVKDANPRKSMQAIIEKNNENPNSKWYCVDMEYYKKGLDNSHFDMVAIDKEPDPTTNQYKIHLIKLKYGVESYHRENVEPPKSNKYFFLKSQEVKSEDHKVVEFYCDYIDGRIYNIECGSGLLNDFYEFSCFFSDTRKKVNTEELQKEVVNLLRIKQRFGLLTKGISKRMLGDLVECGEKKWINSEVDLMLLTVAAPTNAKGELVRFLGKEDEYMIGESAYSVGKACSAVWEICERNKGAEKSKIIGSLNTKEFRQSVENRIRYFFLEEESTDDLGGLGSESELVHRMFS